MKNSENTNYAPRLGSAAAGNATPAVDYLDWYLAELAAERPFDLSQSGFSYPWKLPALTDSNTLEENLLNPPTSPSLDPRLLVSERYGCEISQVVCGHGALQMIPLALLAILPDPSAADSAMMTGRNRRVAVEMPAFAPVAQVGRLLGLEVLPFSRGPSNSTDSGPWLLDRDRLSDLLGSVSAVILTPMHNPSGHMLTEDDEQWLIEATGRAGVGIISDEVYIDAAWDSAEVTSLWQKCNHAISVNSLTKCYGLGSIRFGWAIGPEEYADRMRRAFHNFQGMLAVPSVAIARAAWPQLDEVLDLMQRHRLANLPKLEEVLARHKIDWTAPPFGIFGSIPIPNGWSGVQALKQFGAPRGLLASPCEMFDSNLTGWLRIAWGAEPAAFEDSVSVLDQFLDDLAKNEP